MSLSMGLFAQESETGIFAGVSSSDDWPSKNSVSPRNYLW